MRGVEYSSCMRGFLWGDERNPRHWRLHVSHLRKRLSELVGYPGFFWQPCRPTPCRSCAFLDASNVAASLNGSADYAFVLPSFSVGRQIGGVAYDFPWGAWLRMRNV
jgi:hypothetical protein